MASASTSLCVINLQERTGEEQLPCLLNRPAHIMGLSGTLLASRNASGLCRKFKMFPLAATHAAFDFAEHPRIDVGSDL